MRLANIVALLVGLLLVRLGGAVAAVIGLALVFTAAFDLGGQARRHKP